MHPVADALSAVGVRCDPSVVGFFRGSDLIEATTGQVGVRTCSAGIEGFIVCRVGDSASTGRSSGGIFLIVAAESDALDRLGGLSSAGFVREFGDAADNALVGVMVCATEPRDDTTRVRSLARSFVSNPAYNARKIAKGHRGYAWHPPSGILLGEGRPILVRADPTPGDPCTVNLQGFGVESLARSMRPVYVTVVVLVSQSSVRSATPGSPLEVRVRVGTDAHGRGVHVLLVPELGALGLDLEVVVELPPGVFPMHCMVTTFGVRFRFSADAPPSPSDLVHFTVRSGLPRHLWNGCIGCLTDASASVPGGCALHLSAMFAALSPSEVKNIHTTFIQLHATGTKAYLYDAVVTGAARLCAPSVSTEDAIRVRGGYAEADFFREADARPLNGVPTLAFPSAYACRFLREFRDATRVVRLESAIERAGLGPCMDKFVAIQYPAARRQVYKCLTGGGYPHAAADEWSRWCCHDIGTIRALRAVCALLGKGDADMHDVAQYMVRRPARGEAGIMIAFPSPAARGKLLWASAATTATMHPTLERIVLGLRQAGPHASRPDPKSVSLPDIDEGVPCTVGMTDGGSDDVETRASGGGGPSLSRQDSGCDASARLEVPRGRKKSKASRQPAKDTPMKNAAKHDGFNAVDGKAMSRPGDSTFASTGTTPPSKADTKAQKSKITDTPSVKSKSAKAGRCKTDATRAKVRKTGMSRKGHSKATGGTGAPQSRLKADSKAKKSKVTGTRDLKAKPGTSGKGKAVSTQKKLGTTVVDKTSSSKSSPGASKTQTRTNAKDSRNAKAAGSRSLQESPAATGEGEGDSSAKRAKAVPPYSGRSLPPEKDERKPLRDAHQELRAANPHSGRTPVSETSASELCPGVMPTSEDTRRSPSSTSGLEDAAPETDPGSSCPVGFIQTTPVDRDGGPLTPEPLGELEAVTSTPAHSDLLGDMDANVPATKPDASAHGYMRQISLAAQDVPARLGAVDSLRGSRMIAPGSGHLTPITHRTPRRVPTNPRLQLKKILPLDRTASRRRCLSSPVADITRKGKDTESTFPSRSEVDTPSEARHQQPVPNGEAKRAKTHDVVCHELLRGRHVLEMMVRDWATN